MWIACIYLTSKNSLLPTDPANTESKAGILRNTQIFRFPYPCKYKIFKISRVVDLNKNLLMNMKGI